MNPKNHLTRTRFTWLAYGMFAYCVYVQTLVGLLMPFVRTTLQVSYSAGALHISVYAAGMMVSGSVGPHFSHVWGRTGLFWGGGVSAACGSLGMTLGTHISLTLFGALLMGLGGSLALIALQAGLSDHHGAQRTIALTEANMGGSLSATLAPCAIGTLVHLEVGWQTTSVLALAFVTWLYLTFRDVTIPTPPPQVDRTGEGHRPLPRRYWVCWTLLVLSIAVEWCMVAWSADFLAQANGLSMTHAATLVSVFFLAMLMGRAVGSWLTRYHASTPLLVVTIALSLVGFLSFWLAPAAILKVAGLFISGLGLASFFPLAVSMALETAADQPDLANARVVWGMGLATLTMPLVMGWAAELLSLQQAYAIVAVILVSAMTIAWMPDHGGAAQPLGEMAVIRRETLDARTGGGLMHAHLTGNHRVDNLGNKRCSISGIRHG